MDPQFSETTVSQLFRRFHHLNSRVAGLASGDATARLHNFFSFLVKNYGRVNSDHSVTLPFSLSRQDLAEAVNLRKETIVRILSGWQKAHLLKADRATFQFSPQFAVPSAATKKTTAKRTT